jgi:hypothetical protein
LRTIVSENSLHILRSHRTRDHALGRIAADHLHGDAKLSQTRIICVQNLARRHCCDEVGIANRTPIRGGIVTRASAEPY